MKDKLPTDEVMRMLTNIAVEQCYRSMAVMAREMARESIIDGMTGRQVLEAFASTIDRVADDKGVKCPSPA